MFRRLVLQFGILLLVNLMAVADSITAVTSTTEGVEMAGSTAASTATTPHVAKPTSSSKIIIDSMDDIRPIQSEESVRSSIIFFSTSLSMFAAIGIFLFFRKCVTCPSRRHGRRRHFYPSQALAIATEHQSPSKMMPTTPGAVSHHSSPSHTDSQDLHVPLQDDIAV